MSAFKVYGVSLPHCRDSAKKVMLHDAQRTKKPLLWDQFDIDKLESMAERFYESAKPCCISDAFDAPQFAFDWIKTAQATCKCRDLQVYGHYPVMDAYGNQVTTGKGRPVYRWEPYSDGKTRANG